MGLMSRWRLCLLLEIAHRMAAFSGLLPAECNKPSLLREDLELLHNRLHILRRVQFDASHKDLVSQQEGSYKRVHAPENTWLA
jgi:hypothetical protein